jgi:uncharacterized membrane protein YkoI
MRNPMLKLARKSAYRPRLNHGAAALLVAAGLVAASLAAAILALPPRAFAAEARHCLSGEEQRAAIAGGKTVPLSTAIHALHRPPKEVIKAQLCQEPERLIYMLTLLGRDGKVKREIVDATSGAVLGER